MSLVKSEHNNFNTDFTTQNPHPYFYKITFISRVNVLHSTSTSNLRFNCNIKRTLVAYYSAVHTWLCKDVGLYRLICLYGFMYEAKLP